MPEESARSGINHRVSAAAGAAWLLTSCQLTAPSDLTPAIGDIQLPPGFESQVMFEGTGEARELLIREDGDLFVSLADRRDDFQILGLRDTDGDHSIDIVRPFYRLKTPDEQRAPQVHHEYFDKYLYAFNNEQVVGMYLPRGRLTPAGVRTSSSKAFPTSAVIVAVACP